MMPATVGDHDDAEHAAYRDIASGSGWLVACSLVHMGLAVLLMRGHGALGLIAADSVNMLLRIGFCLVFVTKHFRGIRGFRLRSLFPSGAALSALAAASIVCLAADSILFRGSALPKDLQVCTLHAHNSSLSRKSLYCVGGA